MYKPQREFRRLSRITRVKVSFPVVCGMAFFRQLLITRGSYVFLVMAFHSILFLYASSLISKKYRGDTVKSKQDVLIYNSTSV